MYIKAYKPIQQCQTLLFFIKIQKRKETYIMDRQHMCIPYV